MAQKQLRVFLMRRMYYVPINRGICKSLIHSFLKS
jgi:hypothetical protein